MSPKQQALEILVWGKNIKSSANGANIGRFKKFFSGILM
jgi:hypothetical protein